LQPTILDFLIRFSSVLWEAMPFIVLGALIAGVLEEFLPQEFITRLLPKAVLPAVMIGALLGLIFPMCECGIVVVMRRLLRKGLPLSCCIAYMLAGPIINLVVIGSTWVAFRDHGIGPEMVGLRVGLGFVVAVITALIVHIQYKKYGNSLLTTLAIPQSTPVTPAGTSNPAPATALPPVAKPAAQPVAQPAGVVPLESATVPRQGFLVRLGNISSTALHDFVDITVFLILGAVLAALARSYITSEQIESLSRDQPFLAIPAMMFLAVMMCLCSEADAFVAASFTKMHLSAKVAFLVLGPMLDLKLLMMFTRVFRARLIVTIVTCVILFTLILCVALHLVYQANGWSGMPRGAG
jgi:uncharacterized membrane protein YraQ (UPF0718 family)